MNFKYMQTAEKEDKMNSLKFRCLFGDNFSDIAPFKSYIEKGSAESGIALIEFDEKDVDKIRQLFKDNIHDGCETRLNNLELEGSDGHLYILTSSSVEKKQKMPYPIMKSYRFYKRYKEKEKAGRQWIEKNNKSRDKGIVKGAFSSYMFNDTENEMCFPFRLHKSKEKNKPLFVLLHGAGALGHDNIKQLFDNIPIYNQLLKTDCNILSPQAPYGSNRRDKDIHQYIRSVKNLIDNLHIDFDINRIYVVGTSFGGFCTWHLVYLYPEYFAAAVPVMGALTLEKNYEDFDIQRLAKTPIWIAHASDDDNVRIDSDDFFAPELQKTGADIRYTRWEKYGHKMSGKFYKKEKWTEWCLSKVKK